MASEEYWNPMVPELLVTDFTESLYFYHTILGFNIRFQRSEPEFAYLERQSAQLMLEQLTSDGWQSGEMDKPFGRGINFQIETEKIDVLVQEIKRADIPLYRDLKETWYPTGNTESGQKEFLIQDPDGYLLRFCEYLGQR